MLRKRERLAVVDADHLKDAVAPKEALVGGGDECVLRPLDPSVKAAELARSGAEYAGWGDASLPGGFEGQGMAQVPMGRDGFPQAYFVAMVWTTVAASSVASIARSSLRKMSLQRITTIGPIPPANKEAKGGRKSRSPAFSSRWISIQYLSRSLNSRR